MEKIPFMVNKDGSLTVDKENLNALLKLFNYSCFTVTCEKDRAVISIEDENKYVGQFTTDDTNKSLDDLRQKLINAMYEKSFYEQTDVEILKLLFECEKKTADGSNLDAEKIVEEINKLNSKEKDLRINL